MQKLEQSYELKIVKALRQAEEAQKQMENLKKEHAKNLRTHRADSAEAIRQEQDKVQRLE